MKKIIKKVKGFTLTELIVVIAIIGILAAVLIPSITGYIKKAKISADTQEVKNMNDAYQLYITENDLGNADMEASDVRNIVLQTGSYSFSTRVKDYAIWYSTESKKIYYGKVKDGVEAASGSGKLEDINDNGKLLISTSGSKAAEALYKIRNLTSADAFETIVSTKDAFTESQKTYLKTNFSPDKVMYVGESSCIFTQNNFSENIPGQVIFSDNVQVLAEGQITNVTKIAKLSVPVSLLYLGAGAFSEVSIDKIELKNPETFIETGCFNSTTLSKNLLVKEKDFNTLASSKIECFVSFDDSSKTGSADYTYTSYKNGNMECMYINFYGITFNRSSNGAKRCLVQSKINGNVIEYNYFELNGMGIVAKQTFTYLREVVLTNHYKITEISGGTYDPYTEKEVDGYQFELPELSYKTSLDDNASIKVQIQYENEEYVVLTKETTGVDAGKYVTKYENGVTKATPYTLQVLYGEVVIYKMSYKKV